MSQHLWRGRMLTTLALSAVVAMVLAACGGGEDEAAPAATTAPAPTARPPTAAATAVAPAATAAAPAAPAATARPVATVAPVATATSAPVQAAVLRFAFENLQDQGLHPDSPGRRRYLDPLFDWMIGSNDKGEMVPDKSIVTSWTANSNSSQWTLKVRPGVVYSNKDVVTAKDIKASFDYTARLGSIHTQAPLVKNLIAEVQVPDDSTAIVKLGAPRIFFPVEFLSNLDSLTVSYIMPTAYLQEVNDAEYARKPVGSGPYTLKENIIGDRLVYSAVAKHWYFGVPKFASLEFRPVPEGLTRVALLKSGATDVADIGTSDVKGAKDGGFTVIPKDSAATAVIFPHQQWQGGPLGNLKVRQALSVAIDRQALVTNFLAGIGTPSINYPMNAKDVAFVRSLVPKQDIALAKKLLAESGTMPLTIDMVSYSQGLLEGLEIMEAVAVWWEQAGVKVNRIPTAYATARTKWNTQAFTNPTVSGILSVSTRPIGNTIYGSNAGGSTSRVSEDPAFRDLGTKTVQSSTIQEYKANALAQQKMADEKVIYLALAETSVIFAVRPQVVKGWYPGYGPLSVNVLDIIDPSRK